MHEYTFPVTQNNLCWIASYGDIKILENLGNSIFKVFLRTDIKPRDFDKTIRKYCEAKSQPRQLFHG